MRDHDDLLPTLELSDLATVTGGCKKKAAPAAAPAPCNCGGEVDVVVATGAQAGTQAPQLI